MIITNREDRLQAGKDKREKILKFLRDEIWTTSAVLQKLLGFKTIQAANQTLQRMEKEDTVRRHVVGSSMIKANIWGITPHGLALSFSAGEEYEHRPTFEPSKLTISRIPHQIELQIARLKAEEAGWQNWVRGERLGFEVDMRPDAVVVANDGAKVAIEYERTIKTRKRYQQIIVNHLKKIKEGAWSRCVYVCPDSLALKLQRVFDSIDYVVVNKERVVLTEAHRRRFSFVDISNFPIVGGEA
jgi:hypothetical protein